MKKIIIPLLSLTCAFTMGSAIAKSTEKTKANTTYSLTFDTDGGTSYNVVNTNGHQGVNLPTPTKYGCEFLGWYDNASFQGAQLVNYYVPTGNDTIYAKWTTPNYPVVSFNTNGGTTYANVTYKGNSIALPTPEKLDYTFEGWYENSNYSGTKLDSLYNPTTTVTLYAKWKAIDYPEVTFNSNGGTGYKVTTTNSKGINLPTPTKSGYTFEGWYENSNFSGNKLTGVYKPSKNITIYAKWAEVPSYTLSFEENGGLQVKDVTAKKGTNVTLPTPERYGYHFDGWFANSSLTGSPVTSLKITQNATYYAKWTKVNYVYVYYDCDNTYDRLEVAPNSVFKISSLPTPKDYVKNGKSYPFVRWVFENGALATDFTSTSNMVLIAEYDIPLLNHWTDNGNGTYTTKTTGKSIAVFQKTATNIGSYSITMNMLKGGGGASGIAFRMTHSGKNYAFEEAGTSYIGAVLGPQSGVLEICRVINGTWASVKQVALANLPTAFQNKFNGNSTFSVVMKVESYSDGFAIYLDGELALTHQDEALLADFTGTGWGMRNSTLTNTVTFSNVNTYSEKMNYMSVLTSPSAGTYYTGDTKPQLIHQFADLGTNLVTYSATFKFIKGNTVSGGVGLAFRMKLSGTNMYPYEHLGTSYISAVFCPENGSVQVSRVWGDNGSGKAHFGHLTVKTCTGATYPQTGAVASLPKDLPSAYNTKYTNAADASEITCTMMVKDYGTYFEVYIDGALALTCNDTNISSCTGTGLGIRSSTKKVTITNVSYTKSQASQVNLSGLEAVIPSKKETE